MTIARTRELQVPAYYPDRGCQVSPSCLNCWLPRCYFDLTPVEQLEVKRRGASPNDLEVARHYQAHGAPATAEAYGIHERTVYRVYQRVLERGGPEVINTSASDSEAHQGIGG